MAERTAKNTVLGGAAILLLGNGIVKVIGAFFKIPLGMIMDDQGFGHFSNAYVIYTLLLMISTAGLPVALSKTISEANALGRRAQVQRVFRVALCTFLVLGTVSFLIMFGFAGPLSDFQGDSLAAQAVRALSLSCLLVCAMSAFRGYAQGHSYMVPTAISQVIEAAGKLAIGLGLALFFTNMKRGSETVAAGAIFGVTAGAALGLLYLILQHLTARIRENEHPADQASSYGSILKSLVKIAIPITLSASIMPITTWFDTIQVQTRLQTALQMAEPAAVAAYGAYQKAVTLYNFPASFMVALSASLLPAVAACRARKDRTRAGRISESCLRMGFLIACPAGVGMCVLAGPIMALVFASANQDIAAPALSVLAVAGIFVSLMTLCNSVLQANGFVNLPILVMVLGSGAKLAINYVLVGNPDVGIQGASIGTLVCYALISVLELALIRRVVPSAPRYGRVFLRPLIASLCMGGAVWAVHGLLAQFAGNALSVILSILVGGGVYLALILLLGAVSKEDLALMPKGDKLARLLRVG